MPNRSDSKMTRKREKMLSHLRALDLTDDKGFLCGKILADLGVNVIKIERPGGDPSRVSGASGATSPTPRKACTGSPITPTKKASPWISKRPKDAKYLKNWSRPPISLSSRFRRATWTRLGIGYARLQQRLKKGISGRPSRPSGRRDPTATIKIRTSWSWA